MTDTLAVLLSSFQYLLTPTGLGWCMLGTFIGIVVGAIPGLGGGMAMALILPITFSMYYLDGQIFLLGIYVGGVGGSLISAILIGVPGSPAAVMTSVDGYQLCKQGRAADAFATGILASFTGGMVSWVLLLAFSVPLASIARHFQSFDYFLFVMMGLVLIGVAGSGGMIRSLMSGFLGILAAMVGFDSVSAVTRFTFGTSLLASGFDLLAVLIGAFAVQRVVVELGVLSSGKPLVGGTTFRDVLVKMRSAISHWRTMLRASLIGTWIGILPGLGANIGAIVCYSVEKTISRKKENYGRGEPEALAAAESGNNATVGGALVPMIAIGIPGSGQDVILMAALIIHNVQPGPLLVQNNPEVFYGLIAAYFFANVFLLLIMTLSIRLLIKVISAPMFLLAPIVLSICVVGVISVNNRMADTWIMLAFGVIGYLMASTRIPLAPFVIGFVLGPLAEERLRSALMSTRGDLMPLVTSPTSMILIAILLVSLAIPLAKRLRKVGRN
jgi:putative tricarboxylic transport membrane protein